MALPQPDSRDSLCVLNSAARCGASIARKPAQRFARERARLEAEIIATGGNMAEVAIQQLFCMLWQRALC